MSGKENGFGEDTGLKNNRSGVTNASYVSSTENVNISPIYTPTKQAYFSESKISIPDIDSTSFSWRKLWAFTGPGFLISIAFLDPGNIQCDLQAGTSARYKLLWVVLWSTVLGLYVQWLSARLGVVTGYHLAELCYQEYKRLPRIFVWLMMEIAIIGSDMQEVIGTAIALYLLSNTRIPVWAGVLITIVDTFTFLLLDKYGLRKLEMFFAFLITVMALSFGYEFVIVGQDTGELLRGLAIPYCSDCSTNSWLLGVGIVGAVIMPHNLYLHSGLVKSRDIDRNKPEKVKEANMYFFIETAICLALSLVINIFVLSVFAHELSGKTNTEVRNVCVASNSSYTGYFDDNEDLAEMDIYSGGLFLGCRFGLIAMYIWAIGILAAGQSSTMTGCYAGQFSMEGFLNLKWSRWRRVLFTRLTAILPTFLVAFYSNIRDLSGMNDLLNAIMSLQLPFAAIPTVAFTSNPRIMGQFVNGIFGKTLSILILVIVLAINFAFVYFGSTDISSHWLILSGIVIYSIMYVVICIYLVVHMILGMFERPGLIRT